MNTTSNYVDVSFFFLTEYNTTEQEPAEPIERQEMKH